MIQNVSVIYGALATKCSDRSSPLSLTLSGPPGFDPANAISRVSVCCLICTLSNLFDQTTGEQLSGMRDSPGKVRLPRLEPGSIHFRHVPENGTRSHFLQLLDQNISKFVGLAIFAVMLNANEPFGVRIVCQFCDLNIIQRDG